MALWNPSMWFEFWCVGSCSLLVQASIHEDWVPDDEVSYAVREQEVLYAQVESDVERDVEYFFIPWNNVAANSLEESKRLGLTRHNQILQGKAMTRDRKPKTSALVVYDYVPHNYWKVIYPWRRDLVNGVSTAQILRVADGQTLEYAADVQKFGGCFKRIREKEYSHDKDESIGDAPPHVKKELDQICKKGFAALKPSSSLPNLNGTYVGSRDERRAELIFRDGVLKDGNLVTENFTENVWPFVTHHPLCDGILSEVSPGDHRNKFIILKKSSGEREMLWERGTNVETAATRSHSRPLCDMERHRRRTITQFALDAWDRDLPDDFILESHFGSAWIGAAEEYGRRPAAFDHYVTVNGIWRTVAENCIKERGKTADVASTTDVVMDCVFKDGVSAGNLGRM
ncbi:hypothetical protein FOZ62_015699 [Perkinsus olseni]|uniref:Uncharacterized protein n=1 Tax=Perkinsus olseni TaxID=32597 RepID=A0A7J6TYY2_PEROL|nr:hypothetical protein FOZ62_015699 [Perkinsus olseni]